MEDVKQLQDALALAKTEKDTIAIELAAEKTQNTQIQAALATEKAKNAALESALAETAEQLTEAQNAPTSNASGAAVATKRTDTFDADWAEKTFKIGKVTYGFMVPQFGYKSGIVTYKDILADATLQAELVEEKHALIIKK